MPLLHALSCEAILPTEGNRQERSPWFLQVLSVQTALSIQSHPDKELAERLHANQPEVSSKGNGLPLLSHEPRA